MEELKTMKEPQKENLATSKETIYEANSNYTLPPLSLLDNVVQPKRIRLLIIIFVVIKKI